jgi:hypothetical protein
VPCRKGRQKNFKVLLSLNHALKALKLVPFGTLTIIFPLRDEINP